MDFPLIYLLGITIPHHRLTWTQRQQSTNTQSCPRSNYLVFLSLPALYLIASAHTRRLFISFRYLLHVETSQDNQSCLHSLLWPVTISLLTGHVTSPSINSVSSNWLLLQNSPTPYTCFCEPFPHLIPTSDCWFKIPLGLLFVTVIFFNIGDICEKSTVLRWTYNHTTQLYPYISPPWTNYDATPREFNLTSIFTPTSSDSCPLRSWAVHRGVTSTSFTHEFKSSQYRRVWV